MSGDDLRSGVFIGRGVLVQLIVSTGILCVLLFGSGFLLGAFWFTSAREISANRLDTDGSAPLPTYEPLAQEAIDPVPVPGPGPELVAETKSGPLGMLESGRGAPWVSGPGPARGRLERSERPGPAVERPLAALDTIELPVFGASRQAPRSSFERVIRRVARDQGVSPLLVTAVVAVESSFNPLAVSNKGARGLMQLMPETARRFGVDPADLFDPDQNLRAGCAYLRWLAERFDDDPALVLAAYNAGEGAVDTHGGIPPFPETQNFVRKVYRELGWESVQPESLFDSGERESIR